MASPSKPVLNTATATLSSSDESEIDNAEGPGTSSKNELDESSEKHDSRHKGSRGNDGNEEQQKIGLNSLPIKIAWWNVQGLLTKFDKIGNVLENCDVIIMAETWITEEQWGKKKEGLSEDCNWYEKSATKKKKKGRGPGGMLVGVKKELTIKTVPNFDTEGIMRMTMTIQGNDWTIVGVYIRGKKLKEKLPELQNLLKEASDKERMLIGGDFNARTEKLQGGRGATKYPRNSEDQEVPNWDGKNLIEWLKREDLVILNGATEGDESGRFTRHPKPSVIDYVVTTKTMKEEMKRFEVGEDWGSDHCVMTVTLCGQEGGQGDKRDDEEEGLVEEFGKVRI